MEIEGFSEIIAIVTLAKELHDIGRDDIVQEQFFDTLSLDCYYENILGVISSVFSGFYNNYDDDSETELMIFEDKLISDYFTYAWEFGKRTNTPYDKNPYVAEAIQEADRLLSFCYSMDWKLLGYTKTKKAAKHSKLIVYVGLCECDCHSKLAYNLVELYQWFTDKVAEFKSQTVAMASDIKSTNWKEVMAA